MCYNVKEPQKRYSKQRKPDTKDHILSDFLDMKCYEKQNYSDRNHISGYLGLEMYCKEIRGNVGSARSMLNLDYGCGCTSVYIYRNSLNCMLKTGEMYGMQIIPQ